MEQSTICRIGIIPTRVGTRHDIKYQDLMSKDHPHACGDKVISLETDTPSEGSSPRVWGQAFAVRFAVLIIGIIPTRVGTSSLYISALPSVRDHPHACGDKITAIIQECAQRGSSPRVWGQVSILYQTRMKTRIIPTRVGTSLVSCLYKF